MIRSRISLALFLGVAGLWPAALASAQARDNFPYTALVDPSPESGDASIDAVRQAADPSAAVQAYARALAANPDSVLLREAYVDRMVAFGLPQMALNQAQELVQREPDHGLAWGVIAFDKANRGDTAGALDALAPAVRYDSDDPFVRRTAGQLLAWYDTTPDRNQIPAAVQQSVEDIRSQLSGHSEYADAYRAARDFYERSSNQADTGSASEPTTTPGPSTDVAPEEGYTYTGPPAASPIYNGYGYSSSYDTYAPLTTTIYNAYPDYPSGWYGGYWWPAWSCPVIVGWGWGYHHYDRDDFYRHSYFGHYGYGGNHYFGRPGYGYGHGPGYGHVGGTWPHNRPPVATPYGGARRGGFGHYGTNGRTNVAPFGQRSGGEAPRGGAPMNLAPRPGSNPRGGQTPSGNGRQAPMSSYSPGSRAGWSRPAPAQGAAPAARQAPAGRAAPMAQPAPRPRATPSQGLSRPMGGGNFRSSGIGGGGGGNFRGGGGGGGGARGGGGGRR